MMKLVATLALLAGLMGCATEPMTPEEAARWRAAGQAMQGHAQQMQRQQQQGQGQNCHIIDLGGGMYRTQCQ